MQDYIQDANNNVERVPGTGNPVIASGMLPRSKVCIYLSPTVPIASRLSAGGERNLPPSELQISTYNGHCCAHGNSCLHTAPYGGHITRCAEILPCFCCLSSAWMTRRGAASGLLKLLHGCSAKT